MKKKVNVYVSVREKKWKDLEDNNHIYKNGDIYPREGYEPTEERIKELSTKKNKLKEVLIKKTEKEVDEEDETEGEDSNNTSTEE